MILFLKNLLNKKIIRRSDLFLIGIYSATFLLIFQTSFALLNEFTNEKEISIERWKSELNGSRAILEIVEKFEKDKFIFETEDLIRISEKSRIILDSQIDTFYLGFLITEFFPHIILANASNLEIDSKLYAKGFHAIKSMKIDCKSVCSEIEIRNNIYSTRISQLISERNFADSILLWKEGIHLFDSKVEFIIQSELAQLGKSKRKYLFILFFGIIGFILAIQRTIFTSKVYRAHFNAMKQLEEAQHLAKIGSWEFNLRTQCQTWSKEHYNIFEIEMPKSEKELYKLYRERIHPDDLSNLDRVVSKSIVDGQGFVFPHRVVLDNGNRIKHVLGIGKVHFDSSGTPEAISGTCQDITEQVLKENENRFTFETLGFGVWKFYPKTQNLEWDQSMYKLFEIDEASFDGHYKAWEGSLTAESKVAAIKELEMALRGEKDFNTTFEIKVKSGGKKILGGRGQVIRNHAGEPILMYGLNWDRSKEAELERRIELERSKSFQNAKLASLGEMSAGIAHEINNPLALIEGNLKLLTKYLNDETKLKSKIETMLNAVGRISKIVRGLTKFSRSSNHSERKIESIQSILNEVLILVESKSKRDLTPIEVHLNSSASILCDGIEIEQVLVNLINNGIDAVKNLSERWVRINIFDEGAHVVIQVIDSGNGIPEIVQSKLFQPFYTTKSVGEGTGLGLSISKGIIDNHQATLSLRNDFKNTCFEIRFLIREATQSAS